MSIQFKHSVKKVEESPYIRGDWYRWCIVVDEKEEVLDKIDYVEYLLHETFPNPRKVIKDRKSKFELKSSGWGSFTMYITVKFKDGREEKLKYFLDLHDPALKQ